MLARNCRLIALGLLIPGLAIAAETPPVKKPVAEVIPKTVENFRDQSDVLHQGAHLGLVIIPSGDKAWAYIKEHGRTAAGRAVSQASSDVVKHTGEFKKGMAGAVEKGAEAGKRVYGTGTALAGMTFAATHKAAQAEMDYGSENWERAMQHFIRGYMTYVERTEDDRKALAALPGEWFTHVKSDFSNLDELAARTRDAVSTNIQGDWSRAWGEAAATWDESYKQQGERSNSFAALGDVVTGYAKVMYSGLVKPAARSTLQGASATARLASGAVVFLPGAGFVVVDNTIRSAGLSVYYTSSMGIKFVSPSAEGVLLAGLSLFSYGAGVGTFAVGDTFGAINWVAMTGAAPVAAVGQTAAAGTGEAALYGARVTYDLVKGTAQVAVNEAQAGVVLGATAVTQIPAQLVLSGLNTGYFLVKDAKGLAIAAYKGEIQWHDDTGAKGSVPAQALPPGSVVDLDAVNKENSGGVEVITRDPKVIQDVLKKMPQDLGAGGQP